ncbi:sigma 54-interacting transcriptional regulator [Pseudodesulfovibrio piezophilus]|uniref:HTH-type transcriptional regulatory protein TyrR n=1 Tax=Pseudodesulfovibrio piezophilus (strain DSM 21447 / JCM 15486 / C1TLV30) TaxID=1322246 RepID=M1WSH8_PSEP2|nr:sigma 54-interacting transcriptional regulator [Pseudodesulfovibrio piezophilus]CCH50209.1 putative sigma54 specific transcriptional regulator [Pseudodesulfovibrio piezophilus C1TLV30]
MTINVNLFAILDAVSYAVVAVDLDCRVIYLNKPATQFLQARGRAEAEYIGHDSETLLPLATPKVREALIGNEFKHGEGRIVAKGKELFYEITPLMIEERLAGAVISLQRPERYEELACNLVTYQNMARQLQTIFQSSSDGIWVTDGNGTILDINKASKRLNAIDGSTLIGKNVKVMLDDGIIDDAVTLHVMETGQQHTIIQHIKSTGKQLLVTGTPAFDDHGNLFLVVVNERDITDLNMLRENLEQARRLQAKVREELDDLTMLEFRHGGVVAESKSMRQVLSTCLRLSKLEATTLLLLGESGTGKGLLAKFIHKSGPNKQKPFISVNCAALPDSLFEAELFGYQKGAFTGAVETGRVGLIELAEDGTLFLDEVGETPLASQAKLLKCLDEREYFPLGASKPKQLKCNIIAATNRDLDAMVLSKRFRKDLLYRLNTFTVSIPPLRERPEDLFELVAMILRQCNTKYSTDKRITPKLFDQLQRYPFPGNVRELKGLIRKGVVMSDEPILDEFLFDLLKTDSSIPKETENITLPQAIDSVERKMLAKVRTFCSGTREMASYLGVSQPTVVRKLKKHGIRPPKENA